MLIFWYEIFWQSEKYSLKGNYNTKYHQYKKDIKVTDTPTNRTLSRSDFTFLISSYHLHKGNKYLIVVLNLYLYVNFLATALVKRSAIIREKNWMVLIFRVMPLSLKYIHTMYVNRWRRETDATVIVLSKDRYRFLVRTLKYSASLCNFIDILHHKQKIQSEK